MTYSLLLILYHKYVLHHREVSAMNMMLSPITDGGRLISTCDSPTDSIAFYWH